jgi:hypothetical protein
MTGSSIIFGFLPCNNRCVLNPDKPRTYTYDAEVVIGEDETGDIQTLTALLQFFAASDAIIPENGAIHYVWGKVASMDADMVVGDGLSNENYDVLIEADFVRSLSSITPNCRSSRIRCCLQLVIVASLLHDHSYAFQGQCVHHRHLHHTE